MTKEKFGDNNFEQNNSSVGLNGFIDSEIEIWKRHELDQLERIGAYPAAYNQYRQLPLTERLTAAAGIYLTEIPWIHRTSNEMPKNPHRFDISSLTERSTDYLYAKVAYCEADYYSGKLPCLRIDIEMAQDTLSTVRKFAELKIRQDYYGGGYTKYRGSNNDFYAVGPDRVWGPKVNADFEHPFFKDVVKIVDMGIEDLYLSKITPRAQKLGSAVLKEME